MKKPLIITALILVLAAPAHATIPVLDYTNLMQNIFAMSSSSAPP